MMHQKLKYVIITNLFLNSIQIYTTENMITMFIRQYPIFEKIKIENTGNTAVSKPLEQPDFVHAPIKNVQKKPGDAIEGVSVSYLGYVTFSDHNGQVSFPRKQQTDTIQLLVTPRILPVYMLAPTTIHHWQLHPNMPAAMYSITQHYDNVTGIYYFKTKKINLPENQRIELNTIIIYAHPEEIYVPEGASLTKYTTNLTLPDIYAKHIQLADNALYVLSIKEYFEQINKEYKNETLDIATIFKNT